MGLETANYINELNSANPTSSDPRSQGDDHLRLIKTTVKASFPKDMRLVASSLPGQALRYDATSPGSYRNGIDPPVSVIHYDPGSPVTLVGLDVPSPLEFTEEYTDPLGIFSIGSPAQFTLPAGSARPRIYLVIYCQSASASPKEVEFLTAIVQRVSDGRVFYKNTVAIPGTGFAEEIHFSSPRAYRPLAYEQSLPLFSASDAMELLLYAPGGDVYLSSATLYVEAD